MERNTNTHERAIDGDRDRENKTKTNSSIVDIRRVDREGKRGCSVKTALKVNVKL